MKNQTVNFFDDIIKTLSIEAETSKVVNVKPEILNEFYSATNQPSTSQNMPEPTSVENSASIDVSQMDLKSLQQAAHGCRKCPLHRGRKNVVFGVGNTNADLMFIGEAPGRDEDTQGIPFVGEAGQLLTKMINAMQFQRADVYITNIVKCRPPKNRNPEDLEAGACLPYLQRQIELVKPRVIVVLGSISLLYLLKEKGVTRMRGKWMDYKGIKTMPTFHPAYLLRNPDSKKEVWEDLKKVMEVFGKSHSQIRKR